jgi:hypothetical protein
MQNQPNLGAIFLADWNIHSTNATITINTTSVHSLPILLSSLDNEKAKLLGSNITMVTTTKPFNTAVPQFQSSRFASTFLIGFSVIFTPIGFAAQLVKDCKIGFKRQLVVMGMKNYAYWIACFMADYSFYIFVALASIICVQAFQVESLSSSAFPAFCVLIFLNQVMENSIDVLDVQLACSYCNLLSIQLPIHQSRDCISSWNFDISILCNDSCHCCSNIVWNQHRFKKYCHDNSLRCKCRRPSLHSHGNSQFYIPITYH